MNVPLQAVIVAIFIHSLWGGNPVAVKFSLWVFPPLWAAFFRFVLGVICVALWAKANGIRLWPKAGEWNALLVLSIMFTLQIATMNIGIELTTGAMASVLIATHPLFVAFFAHLFIAGDRLTVLKALGLIVAFLGTVAILLRDAAFGEIGLSSWGNWIVFLSAALLGGRLVYTARLVQHIDVVRVIAWQMIFSLPLFALGGWLFETIAWENLAWQPVAGILYQGIVIAGLGFMINSYLIKQYSPSVMLSFGFVSPISGVLLSVWLLQEQLSGALVIGVTAVAAGLFLITRR